jgi:hypothetical protein
MTVIVTEKAPDMPRELTEERFELSPQLESEEPQAKTQTPQAATRGLRG